MDMENKGKIRPEKLLLQTYASYVRRFCLRCRALFFRIPRRVRLWGGVVLGLVAVAAVVLSFVLRNKPVVEELPVVAVDTVKTEDVNIYGEYAGRIRAQQFVEIHARVEGYLERMLFAEGTYIQKGQTLFIIDP